MQAPAKKVIAEGESSVSVLVLLIRRRLQLLTDLNGLPWREEVGLNRKLLLKHYNTVFIIMSTAEGTQLLLFLIHNAAAGWVYRA